MQCVSHAIEILNDAWGLKGSKDHEGKELSHSSCPQNMSSKRCAAPYVLQNLTSVPLLYHIYHGSSNPDEIFESDENPANYVQPGSAISVYMDENDEQRLPHYRHSNSSDSLNEQSSSGFTHHYITVQLDGASMPSDPISMDLVGLTCFEVNFSKTYNQNGQGGRMNSGATFVVPVVFDVSMLRYSKLIRIYSTVCRK